MTNLHLRGRLTDPQNTAQSRADAHIRELGVAVLAAAAGIATLAGVYIGFGRQDTTTIQPSVNSKGTFVITDDTRDSSIDSSGHTGQGTGGESLGN